MITQVTSFDQLKKAWEDGKSLYRKEWGLPPYNKYVKKGDLFCINSKQIFDIAGWQIVEDDILVPESVGFKKFGEAGPIGLSFGKFQFLFMGRFDEYKVDDVSGSHSVKLSMHKTTFGEIKVGEWFYWGGAEEILLKARYAIKLDDKSACKVFDNRWVESWHGNADDVVYKLVEVGK